MATAVKKLRKLENPPRGGATTMVEAIRAGIWEEMERDPTVFLIGEDVGVYGGAFKVTEGLIDHFGKERVRHFCCLAWQTRSFNVADSLPRILAYRPLPCRADAMKQTMPRFTRQVQSRAMPPPRPA